LLSASLWPVSTSDAHYVPPLASAPRIDEKAMFGSQSADKQ
jgi:hypothetical protein